MTDRGVVDNFAYYLRACGMQDRFVIEPFVRAWAETYDLVVRLLPDIALRADGVRSTSDAFRDEIEAILDRVLPDLLRPDRVVGVRASDVTDAMDWWPIAEHLAAIVGEPLLADGVSHHRRRASRPARPPSTDAESSPQLESTCRPRARRPPVRGTRPEPLGAARDGSVAARARRGPGVERMLSGRDASDCQCGRSGPRVSRVGFEPTTRGLKAPCSDR